MVATEDLGGRKPPTNGSWVSDRTAMVVVRQKMVVPGRWRKRFAPPIKETEMQTTGDNWYPKCSRETYELAWELTADRAESVFGVRPVDPAWELPIEIPSEWWLNQLEGAIGEARKLREQKA